MESFEHQEMRERRRISWRGILFAGLAAGGVTFIMSGGSPWSTGGTMQSIMGRATELPMLLRLLAHMGLALIYAALIGSVVFRFRLPVALATGALSALVLYALNSAIFYGMGGKALNPEIQPAFCHFTFGLIAAAIYKGAAVPKPLPEGRNATKQRDPSPTESAAGKH